MAMLPSIGRKKKYVAVDYIEQTGACVILASVVRHLKRAEWNAAHAAFDRQTTE